MKKYFIYACLLLVAGCFVSCNNDEDIDTKNSIFGSTEEGVTGFDEWLLSNYIYPYNDRSVALMKIVKHVWMEAYDEIWGIDMTRTYVPKLIQLIGNVAYTESGMILGQAEGGLKVTLFRVNEINVGSISAAQLNEFYFKTMHHEFTHILNQKKAYDPAYDRISESDYVGSSWYQVRLNDALAKGCISPYAMDRATEDFAEMMSIYVTNTAAAWESRLATAGATGRPILEKKFEIVYNYMLDSWGVDLDKLREIVQRRQNEISKLDLSTL